MVALLSSSNFLAHPNDKFSRTAQPSTRTTDSSNIWRLHRVISDPMAHTNDVQSAKNLLLDLLENKDRAAGWIAPSRSAPGNGTSIHPKTPTGSASPFGNALLEWPRRLMLPLPAHLAPDMGAWKRTNGDHSPAELKRWMDRWENEGGAIAWSTEEFRQGRENKSRAAAMHA